MIYSSVYASPLKGEYPAAVVKALEYLKANDFKNMEPGRYDIDGDKMYALVQNLTTEPVEKRKPEGHLDYIDVQYLVAGEEVIGCVPDTGKFPKNEVEGKDMIYFQDVSGETFVNMVPGDFCVFFPSDIHRPGVQVNESMTVRKVVVKISTELI